MKTSTADYVQQGRTFLDQAEEELRREDLRQASEKGWGAASQLIKAAAAEYDWQHDRHGHLYQVARRLATEYGDPILRDQFGAAGELHSNFYEGFMNQADVERYLSQVADLVDRVEGILRNGSSVQPAT